MSSKCGYSSTLFLHKGAFGKYMIEPLVTVIRFDYMAVVTVSSCGDIASTLGLPEFV